MKVVAFKIPKTQKEAFRVQIDEQPHLYSKLHQHPEIQISLIEQSEGTIIAGDYIGRFAPGDVFILGSNIPHVYKNEPVYYQLTPKARMISIFFEPDIFGKEFWILSENQPLKEFLKQTKKGFLVTGNLRNNAANLLRRIASEQHLQKVISLLTLFELFLQEKEQLQYLSLHEITQELNPEEEKRMNNIVQFTFQKSNRSISLEEIASISNMTRESFCRYFKERTRKTYITFLNEIRVSNACRLLADPQMTKATIAYEVGFTNLSHFNRVFKKVTGKTPSHYKKGI